MDGERDTRRCALSVLKEGPMEYVIALTASLGVLTKLVIWVCYMFIIFPPPKREVEETLL